MDERLRFIARRDFEALAEANLLAILSATANQLQFTHTSIGAIPIRSVGVHDAGQLELALLFLPGTGRLRLIRSVVVRTVLTGGAENAA